MLGRTLLKFDHVSLASAKGVVGHVIMQRVASAGRGVWKYGCRLYGINGSLGKVYEAATTPRPAVGTKS